MSAAELKTAGSGLMPLESLKSDTVQDGHKKLSDKLQQGRDALSKALGEKT